jgi:hypothetical protein
MPTDLHVVDGELPDPRLPIIPGHEIVGRVAACGEGVSGLAVGARVGLPWLGATCGVDRDKLSIKRLREGLTPSYNLRKQNRRKSTSRAAAGLSVPMTCRNPSARCRRATRYKKPNNPKIPVPTKRRKSDTCPSKFSALAMPASSQSERRLLLWGFFLSRPRVRYRG